MSYDVPRSLHQNSLLTGKLTGNFAVSGVVLQICHPINAKFQSLAVKFPKQKNREFFEANREITKLNRDQRGAVRHHLRNSLSALPRHGSHWRGRNWDPPFSANLRRRASFPERARVDKSFCWRRACQAAAVASRRGAFKRCVLVREPFALIEPWHAQQFWCALNSSMIVVEPAMSAHGVGERHRAPGSCLEAVRHLTPAFSQLGHNLFMQPDVHLG